MQRKLSEALPKVLVRGGIMSGIICFDANDIGKTEFRGKQIIIGNVPSKSNCYRIVTIPCKAPKKPFSSLAKTKELREYERSFGLQCTRYRNAGIQTDFRFEMDVYYPSKRADLDNSLKCVLDCLQPQTKTRPFSVGAISNDNLCQEIILRRHVDAGNPRIEFVITPLNS